MPFKQLRESSTDDDHDETKSIMTNVPVYVGAWKVTPTRHCQADSKHASDLTI